MSALAGAPVRSALVTGARGFIGRHLCRHLALNGWQVAGLGHGHWPEAEAMRWGVSRWVNGGVTAANLDALYPSTGALSTVFHLAGGSSVGAAIANPREDFDRTVTTTADLMEWLRLNAPATAVVAVSSAAVYGAGHEGPIAEDADLHPYSPYGHHKLMMESLCRSYGASFGTRATVARLFSVYGAGLSKQLLWDICSRLHKGVRSLELGGSGNELRDWVAVDDVVCALERLADEAHPAVPAFNVGTGLATPVRDVAELVLKAWSSTNGGTAPALSFSGASRQGDPFSLCADVGRLAHLSWRARHGLEAGLARYVAWFQQSQMDVS
ncbi:NAD(P)-dependent oxidoreductase [Ideonella sp. 4Y11]|uniref:NAD(P)-dependent oxidoreductase n=1 Tax=Ideonella aquatica TaxID=2824119 RepID=A0A940YFG0_9BURK|nr:NAD(P)-dependent oxidoreductase [Ideonella aquatica]MBQ0958344.1 NAD(P)-dependent oxidoreductase [Ideonella aquatica]